MVAAATGTISWNRQLFRASATVARGGREQSEEGRAQNDTSGASLPFPYTNLTHSCLRSKLWLLTGVIGLMLTNFLVGYVIYDYLRFDVNFKVKGGDVASLVLFVLSPLRSYPNFFSVKVDF